MGCENSAPESSSPTSPPRRPRRLRRRPSDASPHVDRMILGNEGESEDRERVSPVQGHNDHGNPFFLESTNAPDMLSTTMEPQSNAPLTSFQLPPENSPQELSGMRLLLTPHQQQHHQQPHTTAAHRQQQVNNKTSGNIGSGVSPEFDGPGIFYPGPTHRESSSSIFSSPSLALTDSNLNDEEQKQRKMSGSSSSRPQSDNVNENHSTK